MVLYAIILIVSSLKKLDYLQIQIFKKKDIKYDYFRSN